MLDFGQQVSTTDEGDAGIIVGALFEEGSGRLSGLVVRRGAFAARDILVPSDYVASTNEGIVALTMSAEELEDCDDFRLRRLVSPDLGMEAPQTVDPPGVVRGSAPTLMTGNPENPWTVGGPPMLEEVVGNVFEGLVAFSVDQQALDSDGNLLGTVSHLVFEGDRLSGLVVRPDELFGSGKLIPANKLGDVALDELVVNMDQESFRALPDTPVS